MRNFFYALVSVSLIGFGFFSALKSNAQEVVSSQLSVVSYPYQITEIKPSGEQNTFSGVSSNIDPIKIIPDLKVPYYPEDRISTFPDPKLGFGSTIRIERAPAITIVDWKKPKVYRSWTKNVGDLLAEKNIELGTDDKISTSVSASIFDGSTITITRVAITTVVETAPIPFSITKASDPNLLWNKTRVVAGTPGQKKLTYLVRREDGVQVSKVLQSTEVLLQPMAEVDYTGTKVVIINSVFGRATMTPVATYIVSPNFPRGSAVRITNKANGKQIFGIVNATWGTASPPDGVVLDLAPTFLSQLGCPAFGCSNVVVDEIQQ
ncbi:MAG: G5 domain-containing protein [Candidatus Berkelbacteria bacterium]|nr:G5 domain-containing protein [Candidatus Berkelbacteria bacterium]